MEIEDFFEICGLTILAIIIPSIDAIVSLEFAKIIGGFYGFLFFLIALIATAQPWIKIIQKIKEVY